LLRPSRRAARKRLNLTPKPRNLGRSQRTFTQQLGNRKLSAVNAQEVE
jgi:hypothetical protein